MTELLADLTDPLALLGPTSEADDKWLFCAILVSHARIMRRTYYYSGRTRSTSSETLPIVEPFDSGHGEAGFVTEEEAKQLRELVVVNDFPNTSYVLWKIHIVRPPGPEQVLPSLAATDFADPLMLVDKSSESGEERITCYTYSHWIRPQYTVYFYTGITHGRPPHEFPLVAPGGSGKPAGFLSAEKAKQLAEAVWDFPANMPILLLLSTFTDVAEKPRMIRPIDLKKHDIQITGAVECAVHAAQIFGHATEYWYSGATFEGFPVVVPYDSGHGKAGLMDAGRSGALKDLVDKNGWTNEYILVPILTRG